MVLEHTEIYTAYSEEADITFILKDKYDKYGEVATTAVVGWHYGEPDRKITTEYIGKLVATY